MYYFYLSFPIIASLIVVVIMSFVYKDKEKKDKGFVLSYYRLTYRRKMIRTLWTVPFIIFLYIPVIVFLNMEGVFNILISIFIFVILLIQLIYNYIMWNKYERKE
ncbi:hypothetical protein [Radiobacillus deserti]|uniref:ATPase n=1 Tax=Radiobacillus deserti TaxID=2594883 RepID=A0A516KDB3_9BACI|nr:hypothetical protein [Radiobacillus deserti]QDP39388.1 hypothetical protein FN924_03785 [Radiobacillus deserti]